MGYEKNNDGKIDLSESLCGPDLIDFINLKLFSILGTLKVS